MLDKTLPYFGVIMTKTDIADYPHAALPAGYSFDTYKPGYEKEWAALIYKLGNTDSLLEAQLIFENEFLSHPLLLKHRCFFVLDHEGCIVATASLWIGNHFGKTMPRIHWVSTDSEHQGLGIAKALLSHLMDALNTLNLESPIYLTTQTWSYKAINIYKQFGFVPYTGEKPVNWKYATDDLDNKHAWELIDSNIESYRANEKLNQTG